MAFLRSVATVGGNTLVSRLLGYVRDMLTAAAIGAGPMADAFLVAFRFPNLFRRLFAEGAFNAAFVPQFAGAVATRGRDAARRFAEDTLAVLLTVLLALLLVAEIAMPWIIAGIAPGFRGDAERYGLAVEFTRITFPYLLFISLVSLQGGVLNSLDRFAAVAFTPVLLNVCMIAALLLSGMLFPSAGTALSWGVTAAGVTQFVWLAASCAQAGMALRLPRPRLTPEVKKLLALMLPAAIGGGVQQVNILIDTVLASWLPTGSIAWLYYADRIYELPLAVIGIAVGTAILPLLARQVRTGQEAAALATQNRGLELGLLLTLPAAAGLFVLAEPIIAVLFERGAFGAADVRGTAAALAAYAFGLPAFVLVKILAPGFYAREDTRTPVRIAIVCVLVNTAIGLVAMQVFRHVGLAIATVCSAWLNTVLLALALKRRNGFAPSAALRTRVPRMLAASIVMGAALWLALPLAMPFLSAGHTLTRATALAILVAGGAAVFFVLALVLRATDAGEALRALRRGT
jgi:putative peptidoglycan lipid II flippase